MNFLTSGVFWGLVLVLVGLSIIIRVVFHIDIPVFRIVLGLLLLYFGIRVIFGSTNRQVRRESKSINQNEFHQLNKGNEYNIVFSSGTVDLSEWKDMLNDTTIVVNVVFGSALILIDAEMPLQIVTNTVFGETKLPGKNLSFLGQETVVLGNQSGKTLYLELNTVFASTEMKIKEG